MADSIAIAISEEPTSSRETAKLQPSIIGAAELMVFRLALSDLNTGQGLLNVESADFGVFVRIRIASADRPRTIQRFVLRATYPADGSYYEAESEREVGNYFFHHYDQKTLKTIYDPMVDLAERLRTALLPDTHTEGWVRIETKNVRHQLQACRITIHAVDATGNEHEMETSHMLVKRVEDREYATHTKR